MNYFAAPGLTGVKLSVTIKEKQVQNIIDYTCKLMGVKREKIMRRGRYRPQVDCRQMVWHLLRIKTTLSTLAIAQLFNCDHSTVIHGAKALKAKIAYDDKLSEAYRCLLVNV